MTPPSTKKPHIIVLGNEKGGTGKSTTCMHLIVCLLKMGFKIGSIDADARQGTLSRYFENRQAYKEKNSASDLPMPIHLPIFKSLNPDASAAEEEDKQNIEEALRKLADCDFVIIDTPGNNTTLSQFAHSYADTLITPLNDSFIDLDMLVRVNSDSYDIKQPSVYAEWVWEQKKRRAIRDGGKIDWIVLRNRLSNLNARNKAEMERILSTLSKRIGFRLISGFAERVIFKELFHSGITLLDLRETGTTLSVSHVSAKQELRSLIKAIQLPQLEERAHAII